MDRKKELDKAASAKAMSAEKTAVNETKPDAAVVIEGDTRDKINRQEYIIKGHG